MSLNLSTSLRRTGREVGVFKKGGVEFCVAICDDAYLRDIGLTPDLVGKFGKAYLIVEVCGVEDWEAFVDAQESREAVVGIFKALPKANIKADLTEGDARFCVYGDWDAIFKVVVERGVLSKTHVRSLRAKIDEEEGRPFRAGDEEKLYGAVLTIGNPAPGNKAKQGVGIDVFSRATPKRNTESLGQRRPSPVRGFG